MSNDTETQTNQSNGEMSPSRDNSSSSCSSPTSTTATAAQSHKQKQSKHKFRHEVKVSSPLPPIQECTLAECIAFLRLENSPTGSSPSSASVVSGDASAGASATQEEPASNESSSTPGTGTSIDSDASSSSPLDCFLGEAVKNHHHRLFILKLERDFSRFLDQTSLESMELPWINSFYRMMIHRVANCFLLERRIDTTQKTITLYRTDQSALPTFRFVDLMQQEEVEEEEAVPAPTSTPATKPIKVLKRCPPRPATVCGGRSSSSSRAEESRRSTVSIKEREEAYAKARARIFQGTDETGHSRSLSSSSSSSNPPRTQSRSNTKELAEESNTDETSTMVGSDNPDFMTSPTSPGPSTPHHGHDGSLLHQRDRSSESSELGYPSPQHQYREQFYGDPSRRTSAPSLGAHGTHRQVVPGARHFVQGSDGVIRYDPTIDTSPQKPPPRHPSSGGPGKRQPYSHQGQEQYTHSRETQYPHPPQHHHHPHPHHPEHHHDQACSLVRQHSAPEIYMTKDPQNPMMCPFVQQHLQQHHSHHHIPQHPTQHPALQHPALHQVAPPQHHLYPPHHRPPPRQATYPVYGIISPPPLQVHQGSPRQGHPAYPEPYPCPYIHHDGYSPDMGSSPLVQTGSVPHPHSPHSPHSPHPRPVSPMHAQGGSGGCGCVQSSRAWGASPRGGSPGGGGGGGGGGGIQLPSYPVYDVDKRPPKSTELYDPKNPKCATGRKSRG